MKTAEKQKRPSLSGGNRAACDMAIVASMQGRARKAHGSVYREPDWMRPPCGLDVSPQLRRYTVVSLFQLTLDMLGAIDAPIGYGHVYAPAHYIDAWAEVTDVRDWSPADITRLKKRLAKP